MDFFELSVGGFNWYSYTSSTTTIEVTPDGSVFEYTQKISPDSSTSEANAYTTQTSKKIARPISDANRRKLLDAINDNSFHLKMKNGFACDAVMDAAVTLSILRPDKTELTQQIAGCYFDDGQSKEPHINTIVKALNLRN